MWSWLSLLAFTCVYLPGYFGGVAYDPWVHVWHPARARGSGTVTLHVPRGYCESGFDQLRRDTAQILSPQLSRAQSGKLPNMHSLPRAAPGGAKPRTTLACSTAASGARHAKP
jgi:hypothetical protein